MPEDAQRLLRRVPPGSPISQAGFNALASIFSKAT